MSPNGRRRSLATNPTGPRVTDRRTGAQCQRQNVGCSEHDQAIPSGFGPDSWTGARNWVRKRKTLSLRSTDERLE
jgi:hypothetical protein